MADFLENEAEEASSSEEERSDDGGRSRQKKPKKKVKKSKAQINSSDEDEEDEEQEALIAQELQDFIEDNVEEEEEQEEPDTAKRRHSDESDVDVDDDDLDLIEENMGVRIPRSKKFKRVRVVDDEEEDQDVRDAIGQELFRDDDEMEEDTGRKSSGRPNQRMPVDDGGDYDEDSDDSDAFIVDDDGQPIRGPKRHRHRLNDAAMQEAQEIFGLDVDMEDFEELDEEEEDGYEDDEEDVEPTRRARRRRTKKSVLDVYEPSDLEHNLRTSFDNQVRLADIPERFQLRGVPVEAPSEENAATELAEEARWIYQQLFMEPTLSAQRQKDGYIEHLFLPKPVKHEDDEKEKKDSEKQKEPPPPLDDEGKINCVKEVLDLIRVHYNEERFIACYRKETFERAFNSEYIREIYELDAAWMQLQKRRTNLLNLMKKMQQFLRMSREENPTENYEEISEDALEKVRIASSMTELQDIFLEFKLRFGRHFPSVQKLTSKKLPGSSDATLSQLPDIDPELSQNSQEDESAGTSAVKRARRTDPYVICMEAGLDKFVAKFGLTAEQFATNCEHDWATYSVESEPLDPETTAEKFLSPRFPTAPEVVQAGIYMMSELIGRNANFRRVARRKFLATAKVNVEATPRGIKEIDESHPCYGMKWLKAKPVGSFENDQYLKLVQARKEGQLKISIRTAAPGDADPLLAAMTSLFAVDEYKRETVAWNALRAKTVEKALSNLYITFEKEVHERLLTEAKSYVKFEIRRRLFNELAIAPIEEFIKAQPDFEAIPEESAWSLSDGIRVMAIAFENAIDQPAFAAVVDGHGDVIETVKLPTLLFTRGLPGQRVNPKDMEKIAEMIAERRPHFIAIASESKTAVNVKEAVESVLNTMSAEKRKPESVRIIVEIVDNRLSMLYQNSETGRMEFPSFTHIQRQAVSLARRVVDPLPVFAQLFNMDDDLLNLNFHPLQNMLSKEELRSAVQIELVKRVNDVGVDINDCVAHPLTHGNLVQFVCGLGPRKAQHLIKTIKANGSIVSRNHLVMNCKMGPRVFINCAAFIKIDSEKLNEALTVDTYIEPLDSSRVHPETYDWARKMAVDALDYDDTADGANPSEALAEILLNPARLKELDLGAFNEELEKQSFGTKLSTLQDILNELNERFKDYRVLYQKPSADEVFYMVIGERVEDYEKGRLVTIKVLDFVFSKSRGARKLAVEEGPKHMKDRNDYMCNLCYCRGFESSHLVFDHQDSDCPGTMIGVRAVMDNGIFGLIRIDHLSDKKGIIPTERVKRDMVIQARIFSDKIDSTKFSVDYSCKSSVLQDLHDEFKPPKDLYYDKAAEKEAYEKELRKRNKNMPKTNFLKRVIAHPAFKNITFEEAERYLRDMPPGEAIIRPHSKGVNKLTITWKVADGILDHVEIVEHDKENAFSLGQKLVIGEESYDDLDEIIARFVMPMSKLVNDMMKHKYYVDSHGGQNVSYQQQRATIDKWLTEQSDAVPGRIPFCFSACVRYPRKFFLCHLPPKKTVREELVTVTPQGYYYRKRYFQTINQLITYFKQHFHEPPPPSSTPHASLTPGMSMQITPGSGVTPRLGAGTTSLAAITQAVHQLPGHVWERLKEAGGSTRAGASATPAVFATPRTPGGTGRPAATPGSVTGSSTVGWSNAAAMWSRAMTGQAPTPGTPQANTPGSTTNWAAAAQQWTAAGGAAGAAANKSQAAANAWLAKDKDSNSGSSR